MKNKRQLMASGAALLAMTACASTPPMDVCSAEWVSYRANRAMDEFGTEVQPLLRTLRNASNQSGNGADIGPLMMVRLISAMTDLLDRFGNSDALFDLQLISDQCNDPDIMIDAFSYFLEDRGASPEVVGIIQEMGTLKRLMEDKSVR